METKRFDLGDPTIKCQHCGMYTFQVCGTEGSKYNGWCHDCVDASEEDKISNAAITIALDVTKRQGAGTYFVRFRHHMVMVTWSEGFEIREIRYRRYTRAQRDNVTSTVRRWWA